MAFKYLKYKIRKKSDLQQGTWLILFLIFILYLLTYVSFVFHLYVSG